jgi:uncharacterized protein YgbK (DUF1537 family)
MDSTLRGHSAVEILGVLDALELDTAFIAPAFPQEGRQTVGGYHLLNSLPLELTSLARDPLCPVHESHLPSLLAEQLRAFGHSEEASQTLLGQISLQSVLGGAAPISAAMKQAVQQKQRLVVVDIATATDLEQLALAYEKVRKSEKVLLCGSAGLAQALSTLWACAEEPLAQKSTLPQLPKRPLVLVSGSNTPLNRLQLQQLLQALPETRVLEVSPAQLLGQEPLPAMLQALEACSAPLTILSTSLAKQQVENTRALGETLGLEADAVNEQVQQVLTQLVQQANACDAHWIFCGGETAATSLKALGLTQLSLQAELEANVPLLRSHSGQWLVTKSGHLGQSDTLLRCVRALQEAMTPYEHEVL